MPSTMDQMVEAGARALCAAEIRIRRRWDTEPDVMERMLPAAVDYAWNNYVQQAEAALRAALPILGDALEAQVLAISYNWGISGNPLSAKACSDLAKVLHRRLSEIMEGK